MTKAALTKVFILVILAFIICLPELLFTLHRVNFLCVPYQHSEELNLTRNGETEGARDEAELTVRGEFDPCLTRESGNQKPFGTRRNWGKRRDAGSDSGSGRDPGVSWFACEADMDMENLNSDSLLIGLKVTTEVFVEVHAGEDSLHLKLYAQVPQSSLYIHPPGEREEEDHEENEGQRDFYCCLPVLSIPELTNHSRCLLRLSNETLSTWKGKETLPWKSENKNEWLCVSRVLWLALLCVVLLTVITTVLGQIYKQGHGCTKKPEVLRVHSYHANPHLDGSGPSFESHSGNVLCSLSSHCGPELFPIEEIEFSDPPDTLPEEDIDCQSCDITEGYNPKLHHRGHPTISSCTEEQTQ